MNCVITNSKYVYMNLQIYMDIHMENQHVLPVNMPRRVHECGNTGEYLQGSQNVHDEGDKTGKY